METKRPANLPLPVGVSEFALAASEYYYVDKTLLIKEFLDDKARVTLFTRPRRFGKTLNMDMLKTFFEKSDNDASVLFSDKKIWNCGETYRAYQGKYPVIFISFKDVKNRNWEESRQYIGLVIAAEYQRHAVLMSGDKLNEYDKAYFQKIALQEANEVELSASLFNLLKMLHEYYSAAPVIIIDGYDTPIQQGYSAGFYDEVVLFMRNFFSAGLKDNPHLSYGFMTGVLRVAKESIFSGLNNLVIDSILDEKYSEYFGFTKKRRKAPAFRHGDIRRTQNIR